MAPVMCAVPSGCTSTMQLKRMEPTRPSPLLPLKLTSMLRPEEPVPRMWPPETSRLVTGPLMERPWTVSESCPPLVVPWKLLPVVMDTDRSFESGGGPVGTGALGVAQARRVRLSNGAAKLEARMKISFGVGRLGRRWDVEAPRARKGDIPPGLGARPALFRGKPRDARRGALHQREVGRPLIPEDDGQDYRDLEVRPGGHGRR